MTFGIIGIRDGHEFRQVSGPGPVADIVAEFKDRVGQDLAEEGDGQVHGVLEYYELRASRSHKLRHADGNKAKAAKGKGKDH